MKVCLANLDFIPYRSSGLAIYGESLALGLVEAGHEVTLIASRRPGLVSFEHIRGVEVFRVPLGRGDWISYAWRAGPLIAHLGQTRDFDVVHFLDVHFAYRYGGRFVASVLQSFRQRATSDGGLPYHSSLRSLLGRLVYYHSARWLIERQAVKRAQHLLATSQAAADEFMAHYGVPPTSLTIVPLGIDLDRFRVADGASARRRLGLGDSPVLLYVGFCTPRKGLDYLAQAIHMLPSDVRLLVVGRWDPSYRVKFRRALGSARDRVIEAGYVPDDELADYYASADLFVFPSLLEGFGLPLAEALACGTPVVCTSAGSNPEVVGPGGRTVPPRDPHALAEAINELLSDAALRHHLGQVGSEWVRSRFDRRQMIRNTVGVYTALVES